MCCYVLENISRHIIFTFPRVHNVGQMPKIFNSVFDVFLMTYLGGLFKNDHQSLDPPGLTCIEQALIRL